MIRNGTARAVTLIVTDYTSGLYQRQLQFNCFQLRRFVVFTQFHENWSVDNGARCVSLIRYTLGPYELAANWVRAVGERPITLPAAGSRKERL